MKSIGRKEAQRFATRKSTLLTGFDQVYAKKGGGSRSILTS